MQLGLVNEVFPREELMSSVREICDKMLFSSPLSLRAGKEAIYDSLSRELKEALEVEAAVQSTCFCSDDHREGVDCFLEKRDPVFTGK